MYMLDEVMSCFGSVCVLAAMHLMHTWCEHHAAHALRCVCYGRILLLEIVLQVDQSLAGGWRLRQCSMLTGCARPASDASSSSVNYPLDASCRIRMPQR
jgi:hypothetical protein